MSKLVISPSEAQMQALVERGLSASQIALEIGCSQINVRRWLKKYGLGIEAERSFLCVRCGETDAAKFTSHKAICRSCYEMEIKKRRGDARHKALAHLGARCALCGFEKFEVALDVHHIDPTIKDPNFHAMRGWSFDEIEKELRGCVVLCKNCHAAIHAGLISL
ncbi:MAG: hypothetical protein KY445_09540 [Armatimonadetes bacterium]|nr:hypothetical protein [Armatimonadota bacterium]